ncbi:hypothetical protein [Rhodopirellula sp. SWK7]|uniref:hypothetical protein n=1 Tax=Rhodopirellula sp. SWK7 TaxID=595460 RepID=UPI0005C78922|nr:hypothetical protein [Rhodopirellula sp. SWK7]
MNKRETDPNKTSRWNSHRSRGTLCRVLCLFVLTLGFMDARSSAQDAETDSSSEAAEATEADASTSRASYSRPFLASDKIAEVFRESGNSETSGGDAEEGNQSGAPEDGAAASGGDQDAGAQEARSQAAEESEATLEEIALWVDQLGSVEFAAREQATAKLRGVGKRALPVLERTSRDHPDLEVRMRASDVAKGITGGETAGRIDAFLAGNDVSLDGWEVFQTILGDGVRIRELFVDFLMRHEKVAASLEGTSKDRESAFQQTIVSVQRGMFVEQRTPTEADLIALILLANDHDMPITRVEENAIFTVLRRDATAKLLTDAQLAGPFRAMLGGWISRDDVVNRQEILWFALSWDLAETLPLAMNTLEKETDPITLGMALQAIARFGEKSDVPGVAKFLDDSRPASEQQYAGGKLVQAFVCDAAAAAIILLNDRSLAEFGLNEAAEHPKYGFIVQEIGFPIEDPKPRQEAIEKLKKELLSE